VKRTPLRRSRTGRKLACFLLAAALTAICQTTARHDAAAKPRASAASHRAQEARGKHHPVQHEDVTARQVQAAYYDGKLVKFEIAKFNPQGKGRDFMVGPWDYGIRASDVRPRDKRLNVYLISPGTLNNDDGWKPYDHNSVISGLPAAVGATLEWDVYWAIVLDPAMDNELRSERDLLLAAQQEFRPSDLFEFEEIPGESFLQNFLKVDSLRGLARYRRKDGLLPKVLIAPADVVVRARAVPEQETDRTE